MQSTVTDVPLSSKEMYNQQYAVDCNRYSVVFKGDVQYAVNSNRYCVIFKGDVQYY